LAPASTRIAHGKGRSGVHSALAQSAEGDLDPVFMRLAQLGAGGLVIPSDTSFLSRIAQVAALALRHRVPTIFYTQDGNPGEWQNCLVDEHADQETILAASEEFDSRRKALASAVAALNHRERRIFEACRLAEEPITLKELADEFGVSRERVRQIGVRGFEKVQKSVKNGFAVMETPAPLPRISFEPSPAVGELPMDVSP